MTAAKLEPTTIATLTNALRKQAVTANAAYKQYDGYWDGPEWILVRAKRTIKTRMGVAIEKGDYTIARLSGGISLPNCPPELTIYSARNRANTLFWARDFSIVEG